MPSHALTYIIDTISSHEIWSPREDYKNQPHRQRIVRRTSWRQHCTYAGAGSPGSLLSSVDGGNLADDAVYMAPGLTCSCIRISTQVHVLLRCSRLSWRKVFGVARQLYVDVPIQDIQDTHHVIRWYDMKSCQLLLIPFVRGKERKRTKEANLANVRFGRACENTCSTDTFPCEYIK